MITLEVQGLAALQKQFSRLNNELPKAIANGLNRVGETLIERERLEM